MEGLGGRQLAREEGGGMERKPTRWKKGETAAENGGDKSQDKIRVRKRGEIDPVRKEGASRRMNWWTGADKHQGQAGVQVRRQKVVVRGRKEHMNKGHVEAKQGERGFGRGKSYLPLLVVLKGLPLVQL